MWKYGNVPSSNGCLVRQNQLLCRELKVNKVSHPSQNTAWAQYNRDDYTQEVQEIQMVSPFPADDHKAAKNCHDSMTNTKHK